MSDVSTPDTVEEALSVSAMQGRSLWADARTRLMRNRAAVAGMNKGAGAAEAALAVLRLKRRLRAEAEGS